MNNDDYSIVKKTKIFDNPLLRHFIKKHDLSNTDALVLGVLLDLTNQMKTDIKTTYKAIAETCNLPTIEVYRSIGSLHRDRIIEHKPELNYLRVSFNEIKDGIEEINLGYINARKIKELEKNVWRLESSDFVPKKDLFDLIYPLIGKIVSKKISDAFGALVNYINERLDSTFSVKMWRCRVKSWFYSIPLSEMILRESLPYFVEEIFLIEKKTGLLIAHRSHSTDGSVDSDLVAGMLTAINDFVKTSFKKNADDSINVIQFGKYRILVKGSPYLYCAIVLMGAPSMEFDDKIDEMLRSVHTRFRKRLREFDGNMDSLSGIDKPLETLIIETNAVKTQSSDSEKLKKVKVLGVIIAVAAVYIASISIYHSVINNRVRKQIAGHLEKNLPKHTHDIDIMVDGASVSVTGYVNSTEIAEKISYELKKFPVINYVKNDVLVVNFSRIREYDDSLKSVKDEIAGIKLKQISSELEKIVISFPMNVTVPGDVQLFQIKRIYELIRDEDSIQIDVVAFSDYIGSHDLNRALAMERMASIKRYLIRLGIPGERINILDFKPEIAESDARFAKFRGERGIMIFAKIPKS